ncbi:MAG: T9SS type A sorting domain-containing protein [Bacteroidetes bacterium]|nr:T9SS type A sorting domain-containing protein [Bacteroidota bacterium]MBU1797070.1 T9SS type A sorting domain-containing protein [Bacteroidota bacterium]
MIKKLMVVLALVALFASVTNAQWTIDAGFASVMAEGSLQGVAVDPDGKVWASNYYADDTLTDGSAVRTIRVYNSDGTPADFSPIKIINTGGGFVSDTLFSPSYGMKAHVDGNILYTTGGGNMFKIDYKTGEGIAKVNVKAGSIGIPDVSSNGTIYVPSVAPGDPLRMFDGDLESMGNAIDGTQQTGYRRIVVVSHDGLTIYDIPFSQKVVYIYTRADEFSSYELTDSSLIGWNVESCAWNPKTGYLWASAGSEFDLPTASGVTAGTWYGLDVSNNFAIMDSLKWTYVDTVDFASQRPRGIDFSPDGESAYIGCFGVGSGYAQIQKLVYGAAPTVAITFEVDMSVQVDKANFDPATGTMSLAGTMNGWDVNATPMSDGDGDKIYSVTLDLNPGDAHNFKFVMNGSGWESIPDRAYTVPNSADTFLAYFDNDEGTTVTTEISLAFQVNMELEIASQRFNPATDTLSARGSFNGWSDVTMLEPSATDPNLYEGLALYDSFEGDVVYYKYAYTSANGTNWETNPPTGSGNYEQTISAADITNLYSLITLRNYNNATLETVVNQPSVIRFVVDMNGAKDGNGVAFPSIDNVFLAGGNPPLAWPGGGWPDSDENLVKFLYDDGTNGDATAGDLIFSLNLDFPIYSPFDIEYKYGANWGLPSNLGANDNEGGVGSNHHVTLFKSFWSGDAIDVFGTMERKEVINGVDQIGSGIPTVYELGQNYPNPFNPTTMINFSIPESGLVTMKIFNILGQEVAELVNDVKSAGSYEVSFDASNLTSGMYIYKIQAGNFSATRKMMLLK